MIRNTRTPLAPSGSGNWFKDVGQKILCIKEKEEVAELKRKLESSTQKITFLTLAAVGYDPSIAPT